MFFFFLLFIILVYFSAQPFLVIYSLALLFILYKVFWKQGMPKIIFVGLIYFWFSITVKIFYADFTGLKYEELSESPKIVETTYIALLCLAVFALGIYITSKNTLQNVYVNYTETFGYGIKKVIFFYAIVAVVAFFLLGILFVFPAFSQLFNAIIQMKMGFLFLFIHTIYAQKNQFG